MAHPGLQVPSIVGSRSFTVQRMPLKRIAVVISPASRKDVSRTEMVNFSSNSPQEEDISSIGCWGQRPKPAPITNNQLQLY